jgi:uncharacterized membrane protein SpoIIM required for sporulation
MREGKFLQKNEQRWQGYLQDDKNPDVQADKFINLIDDLGYSKTFYPKSTTTQFINGLAAQFFTKIYRNKRRKANRVKIFWLYEVPYIFSKYKKVYLFTFLFFIVCVALGVASSIINPEFPREVLGDTYVDMTEANIENGDPFNVYKENSPLSMFLSILFNNLMVSFKIFANGIFFGVGTLKSLFDNGMMLGTFQYLFFSKGLGLASVLVIWIHGTLEINACVIAGTAGLILGTSFLFPGSFTRKESLVNGAKDAAKIIIALIPVFTAAAILESWVTRYTNMPIALSITILLISLVIILWYFVYLPWLMNKQHYSVKDGELYKDNLTVEKV